MAEQLIHDWRQSNQNGEEGLVQEEKVLSDLASSLDSGAVAFPDFIKSLTSQIEQEQDLTVAGRGLSLLPKVFTTIQNEPARHDIHLLVPYLCARLEDGSPGIYYVAEALQIMVKWTRFAPGDAQEVARAVFKLGAANNFSSQTAITRLSLYTLVDVLRITKATAIKRDMSENEFVKGLVTMAELEKNPSCLRALFRLYADLSHEWKLDEGDHKQIFDSYIRYFPITMKDTPKDPKIPTTTELRDLLLNCFVASDGYAQPTFAAMIERLDVDSANTKVEVFKTLTSAVQNYSVPTVSKIANKLWDSLKFEVWNGENDQWIQSSLDLLREVAVSLDRTPSNWSDKDSPVYAFIVNALAECRDRVKDKPATYLRTSGRIFNTLASATPFTFHLTSRTVIPIMDTLAQAHSDGPERTFILEVLNGILGARLVHSDVTKSVTDAKSGENAELLEYQKSGFATMSTSFSSFHDRLLEIYHEGLSQIMKALDTADDLSPYVPSLQGVELLFRIPSYLSGPEQGLIVNELVQVVLVANQQEDIMDKSVLALGSISGLHPQLFQSVILPAILNLLPDRLPDDATETEWKMSTIISFLEILVRISSTSSNIESQQTNFVALEEALIRRIVQTSSIPNQQQYQNAMLASISAWFEATTDEHSKQATKPEIQPIREKAAQFSPIPFLLNHLIERRDIDGVHRIQTVKFVDDGLVQFAGDYIMRSLRANLETSSPIAKWDQEHVHSISAVWTLFTPTDQTNFISTQLTLSDASYAQCLAIALSVYLLAGIKNEDTLRIKKTFDAASLAKIVISNGLSNNAQASRFSRHSNLNLLQLLINKFGAARGTDLAEYMISKTEQSVTADSIQAANTYQVLVYFAAASLASLDPSTAVLVQCLLDGLKHPQLGRKIAQSFRLLLAPSNIISKENSCIVRPLRKGRLYQLAVIPLTTSWRTSEDFAVKQNALIALTGVLAFLEPSMLADNAKELIPVLLEGTNIQGDQFAKNACIKSILELIPLAPKLISEHIAAVIERMTDRTRYTYGSPSDSNVNGRAMALEVLMKLTDIVDKSILLKRKAGLMNELNYALEDTSYEVRSKAEKCKMAWFNLTDAE